MVKMSSFSKDIQYVGKATTRWLSRVAREKGERRHHLAMMAPKFPLTQDMKGAEETLLQHSNSKVTHILVHI